ncbi:MAG: serine/threonine-protein kinase, partial [Steroidobacteraceae bacterium]
MKDRYAVEGRLGGTGAGTVFKATDRLQRDEAQRVVAIKVVQHGGDNRSERLSNLRREYYRTLSLCHESIVKVHELDQADGAAFFTMEFIDGKPLSQLIKLWSPRHIPRPDAWRIIARLSAALAHVHSHSFVHGDLNPHNVMVTQTGELRILDFGASRPIGGRRSRIEVSEGGAASPLPAYSCWEVLDGRPADPRDDIYSLGCIAYELLAGVHPFQRRPARRSRDRRPRIDSPPGLTRRQWQTLRAALSAKAETRPLSAAEWFAELKAGQASTRLLLSGPSMSVAHLHQKKPLPSWIVVPVIGVLVTLSVLSSIHDRLPTYAAIIPGEPSAVTPAPASTAEPQPADAAQAP